MTQSPAKACLTLLLLEDEPLLLGQLATGLSRSWPRLLTASSASEAARHIETSPEIGVLITDVHLGGESGISLASRMQLGRDESEALEVVLISGAARPAEIAAASQQAPMSFLMKPFRLAELNAAVSQAHAVALQRRARTARPRDEPPA
jgi:DNA-binding NtrC family response regulator